MSIKVSNISRLYGRQKALDNVSFEMEPGEVVGFLGPNGAGKSTMMKIIACFIPPSSGHVSVCGFDVQNDSQQVRKLTGYLPENNPLYTDMYVCEYLTFVCGMYGIANKAKRVSDMIELTGLGIEQHKLIGQLSKGYRQRVGIAQALIHDPKVLILDEPTSGLDPNQLIGIRSLIKELGRQKTVMFSSHIMQEAEAVSSRVIIIDKGKLIADGKVAELSGSLASSQVAVVEFEKEIDMRSLLAVAGIDDIQPVSERTYRILGQGQADIRKIVSEWSRSQEVLILGLQHEKNRLEDVFQKLTS